MEYNITCNSHIEYVYPDSICIYCIEGKCKDCNGKAYSCERNEMIICTCGCKK